MGRTLLEAEVEPASEAPSSPRPTRARAGAYALAWGLSVLPLMLTGELEGIMTAEAVAEYHAHLAHFEAGRPARSHSSGSSGSP